MSPARILTIRDWSDLPAAIAEHEKVGAIGAAHLLRALAAGRIALLPLLPDTSTGKFKRWMSETAHKPAVVLIGDDDYQDRGPGGWPLAKRAVRWCRSAIVHGAGAEIVHYERAVQVAQVVRRVLMIECGTPTLAAWSAVVEQASHAPATLTIRPRVGFHPVRLPSEGRH